MWDIIKSIRPVRVGLCAIFCCALAFPTHATWKAIAPDKEIKVAKSEMTIKPAQAWNKSSLRPSNHSEIWTIDGIDLNEVTFFAEISNGNVLYDNWYGSDNSLPKFKSDMLPTDLVELFEASNRIILGSSVFKVDKTEAAKLGGYDAVRFSYTYAVEGDGLTRQGEGIAANIGGKLYLLNFVAPKLHYAEVGLPMFRQLVESVKIPKTK
jgi:hypothetical protein